MTQTRGFHSPRCILLHTDISRNGTSKVGNWTQGEKRGQGTTGAKRILAVIGTGGPAKRSVILRKQNEGASVRRTRIDKAVDEGSASAAGLKRTREADQEAYRRCKTARQTDLR
eukprot:1161790-Prorocentrum_minimum.AAC.1